MIARNLHSQLSRDYTVLRLINCEVNLFTRAAGLNSARSRASLCETSGKRMKKRHGTIVSRRRFSGDNARSCVRARTIAAKLSLAVSCRAVLPARAAPASFSPQSQINRRDFSRSPTPPTASPKDMLPCLNIFQVRRRARTGGLGVFTMRRVY